VSRSENAANENLSELSKMSVSMPVSFSVWSTSWPCTATGLAQLLAHELAPDAPYTAFGLSGAAFRAYFFTPADNYNYDVVFPGVLWHDAVLTLDHYGIIESLAAHWGCDIRRSRASANEHAALLKRERDEARTAWARLPGVPRWTALAHAPASVHGAEPTAALTLHVSRETAAPSSAAEVLTVRRGFPEIPLSRRHALQRDVLQFARLHAESGKEIAADDDVILASGPRAFVIASQWFESGAASMSEDWCRSASQWLRDLHVARRGAAEFLHAWAVALDEGNPDWAPVPGGVDALGAAAAAYELVADALEPVLSSDVVVAAPEIASTLRNAHRAELIALDLLSRVDPRPDGSWLPG
jgi:hypothetical protein